MKNVQMYLFVRLCVFAHGYKQNSIGLGRLDAW